MVQLKNGGMGETRHKYQAEYEASKGCFWETAPSKFVKLFTDQLDLSVSGLDVLDLGAGEGKNAVYLANLGAKVTAVDVSPIALARFEMQPDFQASSSNITRINSDILEIRYSDRQFDLIIAYGILHCLSSSVEIRTFVDTIKKWLKPKGYFIGATFTNEIPPPSFQSYLDIESFLDPGELQDMFKGWQIIKTEDSVINESHPTSKKEHRHSISRIIVRKND